MDERGEIARGVLSKIQRGAEMTKYQFDERMVEDAAEKLQDAINILLMRRDEILDETQDDFESKHTRELEVCEQVWELIVSALHGEEPK